MKHPQQGMALIEVLVSILLFSFGVLGLLGLEARSINFSVDAEDRNRAALFANEVASYMWLNNSVTVPAAQMTTWQNQIVDPTGTGLANGTLAVNAVAARTANVIITWQPPHDAAAGLTTTLSTQVILP